MMKICVDGYDSKDCRPTDRDSFMILFREPNPTHGFMTKVDKVEVNIIVYTTNQREHNYYNKASGHLI